MTTPSTLIGGAAIKKYIPTASTIAAPSKPGTSSVVDITTAPLNARKGAAIEGSTTYTIKVANLGLDAVNGGVAITALSSEHSHTTGANAVGFYVNASIPAGALGQMVFVNDIAVAWRAPFGSNRAAGTGCTRRIPVYYTGSANALTSSGAAIKAAACVCKGIQRVSLQDTSEATTFAIDPTKVTITPAHSSDYDVVSGRNVSLKGTFVSNEMSGLALLTDSLYSVQDTTDYVVELGYTGSAMPLARPMEAVIPGESGVISRTIFLGCAQMSTEAVSEEFSKSGKPGLAFTIKDMPDEVFNELPTTFQEAYQ